MMNADQYRESLRDGRRLFVNGERVEDATTHPLFRAAVDSAAGDYDRYFDPAPGAHGPYYEIPETPDELRAQEEVQNTWSFATGSTVHSLLMLMTAGSRMRADLPVYADRILAYYKGAKRRDIRCVQTITDAKGNRALPPGKQDDPDLYLRIVDRRDDGIVITGAKLHISSAAMAHDLIVMPTKRMKAGEEDWAVACAVPVNAPGVTVINTSFAPRPDQDERYYPYSRHNVMTEGFVVFDEVFVPNERVFLAGEVEHSATFAHALGLWERLGSVRHYVELGDTLVGLAQLISEANGTERIPHIRDKIGEMIIYASLIRGCYEAALSSAGRTPEGWISPDELFTNSAKYYAASEFAKMVRNLHDVAGGSVLTSPTLADLENPETGKYLEKYMRTMPGVDAKYRMRLFHAIRDFTADQFGGWQLVTTLQGGGGLYAQQIVARKHYDMDRAKELALYTAGIGELDDVDVPT
ncbi:4-hydroxyphenylacetate 3-hydroxylase N-terminal domain-containing protein [Aeromicrobium panaciterrae]|uniref:4-hydroxyphenylacetate 3-hydroxylase N-terminal domain-containing protein n=1 Tax=Aeromicrobium panaciterrae TaxID=363861 RepID=UPI0031DB4FE5